MTTTIQDPQHAFARVVCNTLDRRPDRWRRFAEGLPADWPWPMPIRIPAIDGQRVRHPEHWTSGGGAWGCYRSHLQIIESALNDAVRSILILEDDALFPPGFTARALDWLRTVPADWQMLYLGGQHLFAARHPPVEIHPGVYQPYNVNRTHAFALQGDMLQVVYHHLLRHDWHRRNHIDHHLGRLHQQRKHRIYCPGEWLVGQASGKSNINGKTPPERFWRPAEHLASGRRQPAGSAASASADDRRSSLPPPSCVAILGLHSSGSSALAQALWHCGLWFGEPGELIGYWGKHSPAKGGEHKHLATIMEQAIPFPATDRRQPAGSIPSPASGWRQPAGSIPSPASGWRQPAGFSRPRRWLWRHLKAFIEARQRESASRGMLPAIKYPQLCQAGRQLRSICGDGLRIIIADRPIQESIDSLIRRTNATGLAAEAIAAHQRWLAQGRDALAAEIPDQVYRVAYDDLLTDPAGQLAQLTAWIGLQPTADQLATAAGAIDPSKRHVSANH